jgi:four helix bundle protein
MKIDKNVISERLLEFAANMIKLTTKLEKSFTGRHIAGQLIRSATSAGANYEGTRGAESLSDFIHKCNRSLLKESCSWIRLIIKIDLPKNTLNNTNNLKAED